MCGVFGAFSMNGDPVLEDVYLGLCALQHRGQLSAGVAWIEDSCVNIKKGMGLVHEALNQDCLSRIHAHTAIGHVRHTTAGEIGIENCQPIGANYSQGPVAIALNGNLTNTQGLNAYLEDKGAIFHTSSDTETILQLMAHQPGVVQLEALEKALLRVEGAYSITALFDGCLITARDPWGFRPLIVGKKDDTVYVSSESCALDILGAEIVRDVEPGEILVIDNRGLISKKLPLKSSRRCRCSFEYVYFARPDSIIDGRSVYKTRKELGGKLAESSVTETPTNTMVTGMPDSGTLAALGFAGRACLPFEMGIVRNRYVGRTFIHPTQLVREIGVKIKLNPQQTVFKGKDVIVVDDSLVRGTTAGRVVSMIRESGANKVHMRIASPPICFTCYYGIETPSSDELAAAQSDITELCARIGADSLEYLTCDRLREAIGLPSSELCTACFDGSYLDSGEYAELSEI